MQENSFEVISDYFIALSNDVQSPITNLKLQKLVYFAQGWHLAYLNKRLIREDFEAWVHGPVIPRLFELYRKFGWKPILRDDLSRDKLIGLKRSFPAASQKVIQEVTFEYFGLETYELERMACNETPWLSARKGLDEDEPSQEIIGKAAIQDYFSQFLIA